MDNDTRIEPQFWTRRYPREVWACLQKLKRPWPGGLVSETPKRKPCRCIAERRYANFFCLPVRTTILYFVRRVMSFFVSVCCITSVLLHAEQTNCPRFRLEVTDNPKLKRFDLNLVSLDDRTLCISIGDWPNEDGEVQGASQWLSIESAGKMYRAHDPSVIADCFIGDCAMRVKPHDTLRGFIPYSVFGKAEVIAALATKRLQYEVRPFVCEKKE